MNLSAEIFLVVGVYALYLYDSTMLLYANEIVIFKSRGGFSATVGSDFQVRRRFLYLPNPLFPDRILFRGSWAWTDAPGREEFTPGLLQFIDGLAGVKTACFSLTILLLLILPTMLLAGSHPLFFLVLLGAIYAAIFTMSYSVWTHRRALQLSKNEALKISLEAFLCPPFAINFPRSVCAKRGLNEDAFSLAKRLVPAERWPSFAAGMQSRIQVLIESEDEASSNIERMREFSERLQGSQP